MRLLTYQHQSQERTGVLDGIHVVDVSLACQTYSRVAGISASEAEEMPFSILKILEKGNDTLKTVELAVHLVLGKLDELEEEYRKLEMLFDLEQISLAAPIPIPGKILCVGGNYPSIDAIEKPRYPTIFLKPSNTITGAKSPVCLAKAAKDVAYEAELAIVIGKKAHDLSEMEALSCVAGYTIANDIGDRILEKRTSQWTSGKMFDTFTPLGPYLVTVDELDNTAALPLLTRLNGEIVQKGNTADMFFNVPAVISYISTLTTLEPGDVILTGSPKLMNGEPNPDCSLQPGDVVEVSAGSLGVLSNPVIRGN